MQRSTLVIAGAAFAAVAAVFLLLRTAGYMSSSGDVPATATSKADIERIVRNYLLENPEVIFEAVERFQRNENDNRISKMQEGAREHAASLFNAPGSIVAGNPNGDVTIVEFFDYRCGYCRKVVNDLGTLVKQDGNIRLVMKEFPILSKESELAAHAAIAAAAQGKYWEFHQALMHDDELSEASILFTAKSVGLDVARLKADMNSPSVKKVVDDNHDLARKLGIDATPTFFVGDQPFSGAKSLKELKDAVEAARKAKKG